MAQSHDQEIVLLHEVDEEAKEIYQRWRHTKINQIVEEWMESAELAEIVEGLMEGDGAPSVCPGMDRDRQILCQLQSQPARMVWSNRIVEEWMKSAEPEMDDEALIVCRMYGCADDEKFYQLHGTTPKRMEVSNRIVECWMQDAELAQPGMIEKLLEAHKSIRIKSLYENWPGFESPIELVNKSDTILKCLHGERDCAMDWILFHMRHVDSDSSDGDVSQDEEEDTEVNDCEDYVHDDSYDGVHHEKIGFGGPFRPIPHTRFEVYAKEWLTATKMGEYAKQCRDAL